MVMRTSYWVARTSPRFFFARRPLSPGVCYLSDAELPRTPPFSLKSALVLFPVTGCFQHGGIGAGVGADQGLLPESAVRSWLRLVPRWHARHTRFRGPCELPVSREPPLRVDGGVARSGRVVAGDDEGRHCGTSVCVSSIHVSLSNKDYRTTKILIRA